MRQLKDILARTAKNLEALGHPRVSVVWQDLDLVYRRVYNPSPDLGQDIVGKRLEDVAENKGMADKLSKVKQQVIATRQPHHETVTVVFGGRSHVFDVSIEPTYNEGGEVDGLMTVNIEITDLIEARDHLKQANQRLIHLLDEALGEAPAHSSGNR